MSKVSSEGAKVLIAGNSTFVTSEHLRESLSEAQWLPRIGTINVSNANRTLVQACQELAKDHGLDVVVHELVWRSENEQGSTIENKGALFQFYQRQLGKNNAVMAFVTGDDPATQSLNRDSDKAKVPMKVITVQPQKLPDIMDFKPLKTPMITEDEAESIKAGLHGFD